MPSWIYTQKKSSITTNTRATSGIWMTPSLVYHDRNPLCGDEITLELKIEDGKVADVAFTGHGCAISRAAASMMSEEIIGKSLEELKGWDKEEHPGPSRHRGRAGAHQVRAAAAEGDEGGGVGAGGGRVDEDEG